MGWFARSLSSDRNSICSGRRSERAAQSAHQLLQRVAARKAAAPGEHQLSRRLGRLETAVNGEPTGVERGEGRHLRNEGNTDPGHHHLAQRLQPGRLHVVVAVGETGRLANRQRLLSEAMPLLQENDRLRGQRARSAIRLSAASG